MKRSVSFFLSFWALLLLLMIALKPLFIVFQPSYSWSELSLLPSIIAHGFSMDLSMSAYLVSPVLLWLIVAVWVRNRLMLRVLKGWVWLVAAVFSIVTVADMALYPFWKFRIDSTPLFYLASSPSAAVASVPWWFVLVGIIAMALLTLGVFKLLWCVVKHYIKDCSLTTVRRRGLATVVLVVFAGLMIIPIRGGVTVSTMSPGRAYFSADMRLNHAAINPLFNLMHSLAHADNPGAQFNFYSEAQLAQYLGELDVPAAAADTAVVSLKVERPDIYLIILESFSAHLMPTLGGEPIALCLDSIAREGVLFTDFYAESFRTDRGLATILSGYPAVPNTSVFKYPEKFANLPSLSARLKAAGYINAYYYGGDINFMNQAAYLVSTGFDHVLKDTDFPVSQRLSKWGVHDDQLFARAKADQAHSPEFRVIQTSSSHEPFEVPYHKFENIRANAFAYADSCLGNYVRSLKASGAWQNALVVIVPDHWGAYPENLTSPLQRQHIPLVLTGGALAGAPASIARTGSQSAIAPTILTLLGLEPKGFLNPQNLLSISQRGFAWMAVPEWYGLKIADNFTQVIVNTAAPAIGDSIGACRSKAYVQHIFNDLNKK
jgi:phosphoglycerol transferase MdoB-like AlkP superfamily enzyme